MSKITNGNGGDQDRAIGWVEVGRQDFLALMWGAHACLEPHLRTCPIAPKAEDERERFAAALALKGIGYQAWLTFQLMSQIEVIRYCKRPMKRSRLREVVRQAYAHDCIEREFNTHDEGKDPGR